MISACTRHKIRLSQSDQGFSLREENQRKLQKNQHDFERNTAGATRHMTSSDHQRSSNTSRQTATAISTPLNMQYKWQIQVSPLSISRNFPYQKKPSQPLHRTRNKDSMLVSLPLSGEDTFTTARLSYYLSPEARGISC